MMRPDCHVVQVVVRWGDCDPAGIAFYPRFFEWLDQATHVLIRESGVRRQDVLAPNQVGFPVVKADLEFVAPARLYDELQVRTVVSQIGRASFRLRHEVHRFGSEPALLARGSEARVSIRAQPDGSMQPTPLTDALRLVLEAYHE